MPPMPLTNQQAVPRPNAVSQQVAPPAPWPAMSPMPLTSQQAIVPRPNALSHQVAPPAPWPPMPSTSQQAIVPRPNTVSHQVAPPAPWPPMPSTSQQAIVPRPNAVSQQVAPPAVSVMVVEHRSQTIVQLSPSPNALPPGLTPQPPRREFTFGNSGLMSWDRMVRRQARKASDEAQQAGDPIDGSQKRKMRGPDEDSDSMSSS